jgi:hypothetical protein
MAMIEVHWHMMQGNHGKGPYDAEGGILKFMVMRAVRSGDFTFLTGRDVYDWAVVIGGEPTESYADGCTTKETGINGSGLWLFSRTQVAPAAQLDAMHQLLADAGVARSRLHTVAQDGCAYAGDPRKH